MIDIYDEEGYIQRVLEQGLSERWKRDASLLIKYYKRILAIDVKMMIMNKE